MIQMLGAKFIGMFINWSMFTAIQQLVCRWKLHAELVCEVCLWVWQ